MALKATQDIAEEDGLRGLTTRRIAREIGYTVGTLYNVFENLDDLILHLNGTTLDALYEACSEVQLNDDPEASVRALAQCYIQFIRDHPKRWSILFDHHLPDGVDLPEWHQEKVRRLLGLLERALAPLFAPGQEPKAHQSARVLWASLYGICALESVDKLGKIVTVEALSDSLITTHLAGLRARFG
jgi:AcrR family transcriptional regulator